MLRRNLKLALFAALFIAPLQLASAATPADTTHTAPAANTNAPKDEHNGTVVAKDDQDDEAAASEDEDMEEDMEEDAEAE